MNVPDLTHCAQHETCHVRAAQFFGVPVTRCVVWPSGAGETTLGDPQRYDADFAFRRAVIAAAGILFDRPAGADEAHHLGDLQAIEHCREVYREDTGREMSDPFDAAAKLLRSGFIFGDVFDRIVGALRSQGALTGADIESLTKPDQTDAYLRAMGAAPTVFVLL